VSGAKNHILVRENPKKGLQHKLEFNSERKNSRTTEMGANSKTHKSTVPRETHQENEPATDGGGDEDPMLATSAVKERNRKGYKSRNPIENFTGNRCNTAIGL